MACKCFRSEVTAAARDYVSQGFSPTTMAAQREYRLDGIIAGLTWACLTDGLLDMGLLDRVLA